MGVRIVCCVKVVDWVGGGDTHSTVCLSVGEVVA